MVDATAEQGAKRYSGSTLVLSVVGAIALTFIFTTRTGTPTAALGVSHHFHTNHNDQEPPVDDRIAPPRTLTTTREHGDRGATIANAVIERDKSDDDDDDDRTTMLPSWRRFKKHYSWQLEARCVNVSVQCDDEVSGALRRLYVKLFVSQLKFRDARAKSSDRIISQDKFRLEPVPGMKGFYPRAICDSMLHPDGFPNILQLLLLANRSGLSGHFVETGVWRGGASMFARMVQKNFLNPKSITVLCDSFAGFPRPRTNVAFGEDGVMHLRPPSFAATVDQVRQSFANYGLLDPQVHFFKGFFNDSMPQVRSFFLGGDGGGVGAKKTISVLRLDGDLYDSTVDVLYRLYDLVEVDGWVIIDDWEWDGLMKRFGAPAAVLDFWVAHALHTDHKIFRMSPSTGAFWQKKRDVHVRRDLYASWSVHPTPTPDYSALTMECSGPMAASPTRDVWF